MALGASREEWTHFSQTLGLTRDLLPVVSDAFATIDPRSRMVSLGKTPSWFTPQGTVTGIPRWTHIEASEKAIRGWMEHDKYGICIQTRRVRAIDIDVDDPALSAEYRDFIFKTLGVALPERYRPNSGKLLLAFRFPEDDEEQWPKRWFKVDGGLVEWLGDGQQFIAIGTHPSNEKYTWRGGLPKAIPAIPRDKIVALFDKLAALYAESEPKIARERLDPGATDADRDDPRVDWLVDNWDVFDQGRDGRLYLRCPFEEEHTSDSGITSTAYFPAGTGGYVKGHWACLHAHCAGRDEGDFDIKCGYSAAAFDQLPAVIEDHPVEDQPYTHPPINFILDDGGKIVRNYRNVQAAVGHPPSVGMWLAYDAFTDQMVWADRDDAAGKQRWMAFTDDHYFHAQCQLEACGIPGVNRETVRAAVSYVAAQNRMDSAIEWLRRLEWDGVPRIATFFPTYFGTEDSAYTRAASVYTWTALAGRTLTPGCQADMVPVFISGQGARKTSAIKAIAPHNDAYVEINLTQRDTDLSRKLRGKVVGELEELRGLASRDAEDVKAWITRTHEEWVPKFKEFGSKFPRRLVLFGSGNQHRFLADPTGERRYLPMLAETHGRIDPEGIVAQRDQLWAEAAVMYKAGGVAWQDAERLASAEHTRFKKQDVWTPAVQEWIHAPGLAEDAKTPAEEGFTTLDALSAVGVRAGQADDFKALRMERVLRLLGLADNAKGIWRLDPLR